MLCGYPHSISLFCSRPPRTVQSRTTQVGDLCKTCHGPILRCLTDQKIQSSRFYHLGVVCKLYSGAERPSFEDLRTRSLKSTRKFLNMHCFLENLLDLHQFDVEDQSAVWRNARCLRGPVTLLWRNCNSAFASDSHSSNTNVPAFDNLTGTKLE
jgi:hypothetical protein